MGIYSWLFGNNDDNSDDDDTLDIQVTQVYSEDGSGQAHVVWHLTEQLEPAEASEVYASFKHGQTRAQGDN